MMITTHETTTNAAQKQERASAYDRAFALWHRLNDDSNNRYRHVGALVVAKVVEGVNDRMIQAERKAILRNEKWMWHLETSYLNRRQTA